MKKLETGGRSTLSLAYASAILAVVVIVIVAVFHERKSREVLRQVARLEVADAVGLLRLNLEGTVLANIRLVQGLVGVLQYEPDIDQPRFARLGAQVIGGQNQIRLVAAAPDLVVALIYPVEGNEAALGLDYRSVPAQADAARRARDLGTTILAGPVDLVQGGRGFIARTPVFLDAEGGDERVFWGIVSTVIDQDALYSASGLMAPDLPVEVALVGRDGRAVDGEVFYGDPAILRRDPVVADVGLPFGAWRIAAVPKGGWSAPPADWGSRFLFGLAALMIVAPILGTARLLASRQDKLAVIKDREAELARMSWRLEFALAASQVGVWDVDLDTDEMMWDDRIKVLFGAADRPGCFSEADWIGVLHPDDRERAIAAAEAAVAGDGGGRFVSDYRVVLPDGRVRHVRDMAATYRGEDGSRRLVGLVWDVTPDVERQEELELRRLEAEAAKAAKSQFLAAMSHEIRTPMSGVLGMLNLMLDEPLPDKQRERAEIAHASAEGLLQILNDILDLSKLDANKIRVHEDAVPPRRIVQDVIDLMAPGAEQKGLALTHAVTDAVPEWIVGDAMRLRQVLTNLVSNATKFTEAGAVTVRVDYAPSAASGDLLIEVEDTGIGISPDFSERIFEKFAQADTSLSRRCGGTGLGLAISRQLVELMGGTIGVRSVPEVGSTFGFSVRTRPASAPADEPETAKVAVAPVEQEIPPMRILLAEDNATNQYLINAYLKAAGHLVTTVANGAQAVDAVRTGAFDLVLMDVQMPQMDGPSAARAIRALPGPASALPIIALTANALNGDRENYMAAGMTDYVSKPIDLAALSRALLRARPASGGTAAAPNDAALPPRRSRRTG